MPKMCSRSGHVRYIFNEILFMSLQQRAVSCHSANLWHPSSYLDGVFSVFPHNLCDCPQGLLQNIVGLSVWYILRNRQDETITGSHRLQYLHSILFYRLHAKVADRLWKVG